MNPITIAQRIHISISLDKPRGQINVLQKWVKGAGARRAQQRSQGPE
jgi:hypothetical protein